MTDIMIQLDKLLGEISTVAAMHKCHPDEKAIHKLRVRIKMLKAFVIMLTWYDPDLEMDKLKKPWKLFKKAGEIREWQLLTGFVRQCGTEGETMTEVLNYIREKERKAYKQYRKTCRKYQKDLVKGIDHWLKPNLARLKNWPFDYFSNEAQSIIEQLSMKQLPDKVMHKIRREVKVLIYNLKMLNSEMTTPESLPLQPEFLKRLDELLGNWHDARVAESQLQSMIFSDDLTAEAKQVVIQWKETASKAASGWLLKFKYDINQYEK